MTILTDEMIEKAAREIAIDQDGEYDHWTSYRNAAYLVLTAILPGVVEACAQQVIRAQYKEDAVAFIRELMTKENDNG